MSEAILVRRSGKRLPELSNPGTEYDLLSGKELIDQEGNIITGSILTKSENDLNINGSIVNVPAGYYENNISKSVSTTVQSTPSITVDSAGKITASVTQDEGYITAGTKSATKQLTTKAAATIIPNVSNQTIVTGTYLIGDQIIAGDTNLVSENIKNGINIFGVNGTLQTGTIVQMAEGTIKISSSKATTVDCGFQADVVTLIYNSDKVVSVNLVDLNSVWALIPDFEDDFSMLSIEIERNTSGFKICSGGEKVDWDYNWGSYSNLSISYKAVKFT